VLRDDFVLAPENAWAQEHLTLEDALSHRTGFPRHDKSLAFRYRDHAPPASEGPGEERHDRSATSADFTRSLRYLPAVAEPRVVYRYCNLMYMVVSHAIQTLVRGSGGDGTTTTTTTTRLGDLLRERIWKPLGMNATYFSLSEARAAPEHLASGYYWDYAGENKKKNNSSGGGGGFKEVPQMGISNDDGAGSTISTVEDYARWMRCLVDAAAPLSAAGHAAVTTPRTANARPGRGFDGPSSYCFGWYSDTYRGHRVLTHSGGMEAYGADLFFFPGLRYGIIAMGNTALSSNFAGREMIWKLINDRLGVPESERFDWSTRYVLGVCWWAGHIYRPGITLL
jgi:CubicO group peptidase (beta-lactamase class C family)